jgi:hypothetical protein
MLIWLVLCPAHPLTGLKYDGQKEEGQDERQAAAQRVDARQGPEQTKQRDTDDEREQRAQW